MKLLKKPVSKLANQEIVGNDDDETVSNDIKHLVSICNLNKFIVLENFNVISDSPSGFIAELLPEETFECILYDSLFKGFMYREIKLPKAKLKESFLENKKLQFQDLFKDVKLGKNAWCGLFRLIDLKSAEERFAVACIADTGLDLDEMLFKESGNRNEDVIKRLQQQLEEIAFQNRCMILNKLCELLELPTQSDNVDYVITGFKGNTYYSLASDQIVIQSPIDDIYVQQPSSTLKAAQSHPTDTLENEEHNVILCEEKIYKYTQIAHNKPLIVFKPLLIHISI